MPLKDLLKSKLYNRQNDIHQKANNSLMGADVATNLYKLL